MEQSKKRAWRIGQTEQCRIYYLAYDDTFQRNLAFLIAQKAQATAAINGDVSSDGLSAMLGDSGDLQSLLVNSIKNGTVLEGSAEEWVHQTSDAARQLLAQIGKTNKVEKPIKPQETTQSGTENKVSSSNEWNDFIDLLLKTEAELNEKENNKSNNGKRKKSKVTEDQLTFDFFAM